MGFPKGPVKADQSQGCLRYEDTRLERAQPLDLDYVLCFDHSSSESINKSFTDQKSCRVTIKAIALRECGCLS